ncbi:MAG: Folate-dependent protein for Fe/S cluster synthesis/repair in oxidative stress [uncultured Thiotrichaceae bacterium]|uniref:Folate-dependent protein for Fe/S cluster synthesis/repair in oxidative stress n=1 Tax=uncultured Thiotrichaceae bacterium TaxID=298394 RepID=A0A6S6ULK7_9GAMM|nr:MAG: Folate-dependent protein for Fe/S cluster synthesis/repair in oxidative stress [uncultured Thiotrichaceae bacterium]
MNQQWKKHLIGNGAEFEGDVLTSFGNPGRERRIPPQGDILCDLSHMGLISVSGDDATTFLQNQFTNDITHVTEEKGQLTAWCNPKGRVLATFVIHKNNDTYYLSLAADLVEFVLKRLRMYVLMSKVVLEDVGQSVIRYGASGQHIEADWGLCCKETGLPEQDYDVVSEGHLSVMRIPGDVPRFEVFGEYDQALELWQKLNVRAAPVNADAWAYQNIAAGIPHVCEASTEAWIPQMLNLQIINGVNFKKGCFPGQEVVARLKYLGKNKRRIFRMTFATDDVPAIGSLVVTEDGGDAGKVLNAVMNPNGELELLAVLKIANAEQPLYLGSKEGAVGTMLALPYVVDEE